MSRMTHEPFPAAESLGETKVRNVLGFIWRNARPTALWQRLGNWNHRYASRYFQNANRPGMKLPITLCLGAIYFGQNSHEDHDSLKVWQRHFQQLVPARVQAELHTANLNRAHLAGESSGMFGQMLSGATDAPGMKGYAKDLEEFYQFMQKVVPPIEEAAEEQYAKEDYTLIFGKRIGYGSANAVAPVRAYRAKELEKAVWQATLKELEKPDLQVGSMTKFAAVKVALIRLSELKGKDKKATIAAYDKLNSLQNWILVKEFAKSKGLNAGEQLAAHLGTKVLTDEEVAGYEYQLCVDATVACKKVLESETDVKKIREEVVKAFGKE